MRIGVTLDDDLVVLLKRRARELREPFNEIVNRAIRAGLQQPPRTIPHSFGLRPGIDPDKLGQLADEL